MDKISYENTKRNALEEIRYVSSELCEWLSSAFSRDEYNDVDSLVRDICEMALLVKHRKDEIQKYLASGDGIEEVE